MTLTASMKEFILHWGEMGARWGVNRTVAQIHALLYLSLESLPAEEIADVLIVLLGLSSLVGIDAYDALLAKEAKNRERVWK